MRGERRLWLSVVGLATTLVVCVIYLFAAVLEVPLTKRPEEVTIHLARTGGLFEGSAATYRGVRVGTVSRIAVGADGRAEATVTLRGGAEVPRETRAAVRSLSPVGEQFLDFRPRTDEGPYLADGDELSASAIDLPVSLAEATDGMDRLLGQVDGRDVRVVLRELDAAVSGSGDDLDRLLGAAHRLSGALEESYPDTADLLRNGETMGELFAAHRGRLAGLSDSARRLAAWLRDFDPRFRHILRESPRDLDTVGGLVSDLRPLLPPLLSQLYGATDLLWEREPHLRELGDALSHGAGRFASAFRGGWLRVDVLLQGQANCDYGSIRHEPATSGREPWNHDGRCGPGVDVWRGAGHAPPPLNR